MYDRVRVKVAKLISGELLRITGRINDAIVAAIIAATVAVSCHRILSSLIACRTIRAQRSTPATEEEFFDNVEELFLCCWCRTLGPDSLLIT